MIVAFRSGHRERCLEMRLVLEAAGIDSRVVRHEGDWLVLVRPDDLSRAQQELQAYGRETDGPALTVEPSLPMLPGGTAGVLGYVTVLVGVAVLAGERTFGADWLEAGRMHAGSVVDGQWWRVFTALTLHVDGAHLLGNALFGSVFGFFAAQALGGGVAWLAILLAGGLGNALNALLRDPAHSAVGASTAVFAILGMLVVYGVRHRRRLPRGARRFSPLFGGLLLLAYTGMGGVRTDVLAHVTGFGAGLLCGAAAGRLGAGFLVSRGVQRAAAFSTIAILVLGWALALS